MNTPAEAILATLMDRPLVADPFPLYHELRALDPVHREPNGIWYLTRFDDCERVFRSPTFGHGGTHLHGASGRRAELLSLMFSFDDPPEHTRKRAAVGAPFSAASTATYRPRLRELIDQLLDPITPGDSVDLDDLLSARLPVLVTCELLGIPASDRERCVHWVELMTSSNQPVMTGEHAERILADADDAAAAVTDYFGWLIGRPADDLRGDIVPPLADLLRRGACSRDEVIATLVLLMAAGFETTRYTITGGLTVMAAQPDTWTRARAAVLSTGDLSSDAVEELLRHQGPIHGA
ncbi:MAG TPA: hypothetical protein VGQ20_15285, partial [Acidimicrobiales bacterium]|nr:hypothetical protein [Acidimicrobiales bacterium]